MILENFNPASAGVTTTDNVLVESANFVGDASELAELTMVSMSEMANLTLAMARIEHKASLNEDGNGAALLEAGVKEFFTKRIESLKKLWDRFVEWLGSAWTRLKDVFVQRQGWLSRNASALAGLTNEQLKDVKASFGDAVTTSNFEGVVSESIKAAQKAVDDAKNVAAGEEKPFRQRVTDAVTKPLKKRDAARSIAKNIHDSLVGEVKEQDVNASIVKAMLAVAKETYAAMEKMSGAKAVAQAAVKHAEGMAVVEGNDKASINARLTALSDVASVVNATIAGYVSALGTANQQAMNVLVRASKQIEKKDDSKKPVQESGSVLNAYMG